jgi:hypothetical protein
VLCLVKNNDEIPLYFEMFRASALGKAENILTTATMGSCTPRFIMPGKFAIVWCTSKPGEFTTEQLGDITAPHADCFGFPKLTDASEDCAVSNEASLRRAHPSGWEPNSRSSCSPLCKCWLVIPFRFAEPSKTDPRQYGTPFRLFVHMMNQRDMGWLME